jgi:hypothetical protein
MYGNGWIPNGVAFIWTLKNVVLIRPIGFPFESGNSRAYMQLCNMIMLKEQYPFGTITVV